MILMSSDHKSLLNWSVAGQRTTACVREPNGEQIQTFDVSPDGRSVAALSTNRVSLYSLPNMVLVRELPDPAVTGVEFTQDSRKLWTHGARNIEWNRDSGTATASYPRMPGADIPEPIWYPWPASPVCFRGDHNNVIEFDHRLGREVAVGVAHQALVTEIQGSRHGDLLATASSDNSVRLWKVSINPRQAAMEQIAVLRREIYAIPARALADRIVFSRDGSTLMAQYSTNRDLGLKSAVYSFTAPNPSRLDDHSQAR